MELAHAVKEVASQGSHFQFLYNLQVGPDAIICVKKTKTNNDMNINKTNIELK